MCYELRKSSKKKGVHVHPPPFLSTAFSNLQVDSRYKSVRKKNRKDDRANTTVQELKQVKNWSFMKSVDEKIIL